MLFYCFPPILYTFPLWPLCRYCVPPVAIELPSTGLEPHCPPRLYTQYNIPTARAFKVRICQQAADGPDLRVNVVGSPPTDHVQISTENPIILKQHLVEWGRLGVSHSKLWPVHVKLSAYSVQCAACPGGGNNYVKQFEIIYWFLNILKAWSFQISERFLPYIFTFSHFNFSKTYCADFSPEKSATHFKKLISSFIFIKSAIYGDCLVVKTHFMCPPVFLT